VEYSLCCSKVESGASHTNNWWLLTTSDISMIRLCSAVDVCSALGECVPEAPRGLRSICSPFDSNWRAGWYILAKNVLYEYDTSIYMTGHLLS